MILGGRTLRALQFIDPFSERVTYEGMSYGLGPAGYDVRVEFDEHGQVGEHILGPGEFLLASTIERFRMPWDVVGIVHDKSSWARQGLALQNTVIEPGWCGWLTLEITNHESKPIRLVRGQGIAQVIFHRVDDLADPYVGKYQGQERGPQAAR